MKNKILVTGASGFVGKHLIQKLLSMDFSIIAISRNIHKSQSNIKWVQADITKDNLFQEMQDVEYIFHLAAELSESNNLYEVNVEATASIVKSAIKANVSKFIYISSIAAGEVNIDNKIVIDETNGSPISKYGISKLEGENQLKLIAESKIEYIIYRPTALFGEEHLGSFYDFVKVIKSKRYVQIGNGKNPVNFLYIKDFIEYITSVSFSNQYNETFIINHECTSLSEFTEYITDKLRLPKYRYFIPYHIGIIIGYIAELLQKYLKVNLPISRKRVKAIVRNCYYSPSKVNSINLKVESIGIEKGVQNTIDYFEKKKSYE
tara:strand:- start:1979 stop:2938 length:960 start_codon:yes stop_codon:yes gene_type:complete